MCDILKGVILVMCYFMMHYVDYSMMYHLIRGQSVIKLYIIYNMLEVRRASFSRSGRPPARCRWHAAPSLPVAAVLSCRLWEPCVWPLLPTGSLGTWSTRTF